MTGAVSVRVGGYPTHGHRARMASICGALRSCRWPRGESEKEAARVGLAAGRVGEGGGAGGAGPGAT